MRVRKIISYLVEIITIALAVSFIFMLLFKADFFRLNETVVFKEAAPVVQHQSSSGQTSAPYSYADAVDAAAPAVVNIFTTKVIATRVNPLFNNPAFKRFFPNYAVPAKRYQNSLGSGVIVSGEGYVLTNNHVIAGATEIRVALNDGRSAIAKLVGADSDTDLAVLKIDLDDLSVITLGADVQLRVGDVVLAIGNGFGVGQGVTMGIVSATGRHKLGISTIESFIQTDAAINPGNSGGALINPQGQLVGINTAIFSKSGGSQGVGFAIPLAIVKKVMKEIIEFGYALRGWMGINVQVLTPRIAESFNLKGVQGIVITGVLVGGAAHKADLKPGDVITHINGQPVTDTQQTMSIIAQAQAGTILQIDLYRQGEKMRIDARVEERPRR